MIKLNEFHKSNPVVAEGCRALNKIPPETSYSYITYRDWVITKKHKISAANRVILCLKGLKP